MKKLTLALVALAMLCTVSCKKENVNPEGRPTINKVYMGGGGDKKPSGTYD